MKADRFKTSHALMRGVSRTVPTRKFGVMHRLRRLETPRTPLPDVVVSQFQKELTDSESAKPPAIEEEGAGQAIRYLALRTAPTVRIAATISQTPCRQTQTIDSLSTSTSPDSDD